MISLTEKAPDLIKMEIKMHIPQMDVIQFLQKKGYEIKSFSYIIPATEEMLLNEPALQINTFTATKPDEKQNNQTLYLKVFETELKSHLKELE